MTSATGDLDAFATSISLLLPNGRSVPATLHKFDQMSKVYGIASAETGAKESLVRIKFTGKVLKRNQSTSNLGLISGMVLRAEVITERKLELSVNIVRSGTPEEVTFEIANTSTMKDLILRLKSLGYTNAYKLYFGTKELPTNNEVLYDLKIGNNSTLVAKPVEVKVNLSSTTDISADGVANSASEACVADSIPEFSADGNTVEVVFSFDTTGSMYGILTQVRESLKDLVNQLIKDITGIRIGIIAHGNYCCEAEYYVVKKHELSNDAASLSAFAMGVGATGGDGLAAYELVLRTATQLRWHEGTAKALVLIGDVRPNRASWTDQNIYWQSELDLLSGMGVKVYGVQALNNREFTPFYKELADRTNGAYVKFSNFSLIKEMFLAVCYNEAGEKHMEVYTGQVQAEGKMTEEKKKMFEQLKEMHVSVKDDKASGMADEGISADNLKKSMNYVAEAWFDKALDKDSPGYKLHPTTKKWMPKRGVDERLNFRSRLFRRLAKRFWRD